MGVACQRHISPQHALIGRPLLRIPHTLAVSMRGWPEPSLRLKYFQLHDLEHRAKLLIVGERRPLVHLGRDQADLRLSGFQRSADAVSYSQAGHGSSARRASPPVVP